MTERDIEGWLHSEISRRRLLRQAGAGVTALSFASFLAACGDDDGGLEGGGGDQSADVPVIEKGEIADELNFSNWPLYIDVEGKRRPTLEKFEQEYGTKVNYTEEINDNTEFFGKVRQIYDSGDSGGRDLHVVTDWMASKMKQLGYVQKLDKSELPNVEKNLLDSLRAPSFDPNREFAIPWQSGFAAIIYRSDLVQPKGVADLFDPKHKGKVTMLTEMRDSLGLVMLGEGMNPEEASTDEMLEAIEKIEQASESGQIRRFTGNDYSRDLLKGDVVMSVGWSGDAIQLQADNEDIQVLLPEEGFMLWSDNMQIPVGAPHAYTAQKFMDFVYQPEIAADIAAWVNYVTPVKGTQEVLAKKDPELAENPLIFPSDEDLERSYIFRELSAEEDREVTQAFERAIGA